MYLGLLDYLFTLNHHLLIHYLYRAIILTGYVLIIQL